MSIGMEQTVLRWISIMVAAMVVGIMAITIISCGSSNNTPSETVDKLYKLTQERNCQEIAKLVIDTYPELADRYVNSCPQIADRLVSYTIKGETFATDEFVRVDVDVTIMENGEEETDSVKLFLVKRGDEWKLAETENRSSKPPN